MNDSCPPEFKLSAFHDGELPAAERASVAEHLENCISCTRHIEQFQLMSALLIGAQPDGLSQIAWKRLHLKLDEVVDGGAERGLIRWAWEVSGVAAAVLLAGSIWLAQLADPSSATASVPPWVGVQTSANPALQEAPTPAAVWYMADSKSASELSP